MIKAVGVSFCGNFINPGAEAGALDWEFRRPVPQSGFCFWFTVSTRASPLSPFYASSCFICQTGSFVSCPASLLLGSSNVGAGNRNEPGGSREALVESEKHHRER